ncbi:MAG: MotA/TolQ/ExbB proton channel family protein [bacterium]
MELIVKSGIFIYPIIAMSVFGLFIIIERAIFFLTQLPSHQAIMRNLMTENQTDHEPDTLFSELSKAIKSGKFDDELIGVYIEKEVAQTVRFLNGLAVIAQSSPLLGLLGTVTGLIAAFVQIESLGEAVTPSDLAGGIWEALLTTAAGLFVAIPAAIASTIFQSQASRYERWLYENVVKMKSKITGD